MSYTKIPYLNFYYIFTDNLLSFIIMIYFILACSLNCTDIDLRNSEAELITTLPILYPNLEFKSFELGIEKSPSDASLFLLFSQSEIILNFLRSHMKVEETPILVINGGNRVDQTFYTESSIFSYLEAFNAVIKSQKMMRIGLIYSLDDLGLEVFMHLKNKGHLLVSAYISKNTNQEKVTQLIGKYFKSRGITDYLVIVSENLCKRIEKSFSDMKLYKKWNIVVYGKKCIGMLEKQGSLIVVPEGLENVMDTSSDKLGIPSITNSYYLHSVKKYLDLLNGKEIYNEQIISKFSNRIKSYQFSLVNLQSSHRVLVGEIADGLLKIVSRIIYPSGLDFKEIVYKIPIRLSANTGIKNPPGYPDVYQNAKNHQGTYFALEKLRKSDKILNHFELELFDNIPCGVSFFDYNYSRDCYLSIKDELGVAYIPSFYDSTALTIKQFKDLEINIPIISGMGTGFESIDEFKYTNFFRLVQPFYFCSYYDMISMNKFKWRYINFFYTDDTWGEGFYKNYLEFENQGFVEIVNEEKLRKIPFKYKPQMQDEYREHMKSIQESGCNLIVLAMSDPAAFFFLESFADFGIEYGEYIILFKAPNVHDAATAGDGNKELRKKLLKSVVYSYFLFNDGDYGESIKKEFENSGYDSKTPEYYIDTVFTIANTIEYLLLVGKDFEDPKTFIEGLLNIKFYGVTGRVSFDSVTRLRNAYSCNQYNVYFDDYTNEFKTNHFIKINPFASDFYTIYNGGIKWKIQYQVYPNLKLKYFDCPYFAENIVDSKVSSTPQLIINIILLTSSIIAVFLIYKNLKLVNLELLHKVSFIDILDILQIILAIVEPLQMITIGPSLTRINQLLNQIIILFSMNLLKFASLRSSSYWIFYFLNLSLAYFWLILCFLSTKVFKNILKGFQAKISNLKIIISPLVIHYLFIPIIYTASSILSCQNTEKRNLEISFLDHDCNFQCWTKIHIIYVTISLTLIIILSSTSIIFRVAHSGAFRNSNIKSNGNYLILQNAASLFIVSHSKIIETKSNLTFASVFLAIIVFLLVMSFKYKPYNYDRINLWIRILFSCIIWHDVIIIFNSSFGIGEYILNSIYFSGWAILLFLGVCLHLKLPPSLLIIKEGRTILQMIRLGYRLGLFNSFNSSIIRRVRKFRRIRSKK